MSTPAQPRRARPVVGKSVAVLMAMGLGCAGALPAASTTASTASGLQLVVERKPSGDAVHLALWVDAGSRDAAAPQIATIAAWSARMEAGPETTVQCLPDGIRFERSCSRANLDGCLRELSAALSARQSAELERLKAHLVARRRNARSSRLYDARETALRALIGRAATSFEPLGTADDDARVTTAAIEGFLGDHFGPSRSLLVVQGDITMEEVTPKAEAAFAAGRQANEPRRTRTVNATSNVVTESGKNRSFAIAVASPTLKTAIAIADVLTEGNAQRALETHVMPLRGAALTLVAGAEPTRTRHVAALARRVWTYSLSDVERRPHERSPGWSFIARGENLRQPVVAVGLVGDWHDEPRTLVDALAPSESELEWRHVGAQKVATTPGGARLIREVADETLVVLRVRPGSSGDPPDLHGVNALVARVLADACGAEPFVTPVHWGIAVHPVRNGASEAANLLDCVLTPAPTAAGVERARATLAAQIDGPRRAIGWGAALAFPEAPGIAAPLGELATLQRLTRSDVEGRLTPRAQSVELVWMGPEGPGEPAKLSALARRLDELPRRAAARPTVAPSLEAPELRAYDADIPDGAPRAVVAIRGRPSGPRTSAIAAAQAYAAQIVRHSRWPGVVPETVVHGGSPSGEPFVILSYRVNEDALDAFPTMVARARNLERTSTPALETVRLALQLALAEPWARATGGLAPPITEDMVRAGYDGLRDAAPRFGIARHRH